jgi:hypothetical protein
VYGQTVVPAGLGGVVGIAAGALHNLALKSDGTVVAWGSNNTGQTAVPSGLTEVRAVAAGTGHSLALKNDGTVVAWGRNEYGQATVPAGLSGVLAIAAGPSNSLALKADGTLVAWGSNSSGQSRAPAGLSGMLAIAAASEFSLALADRTKVPPPSLACPAPKTIKNANLGAIGPLTYSATPVGISLAQLQTVGGTAAAVCGIASLVYSDTQSGTGSNTVVTRTFRVADYCGKSAACQQAITFANNPPPQVDLAISRLTYSASTDNRAGFNLPVTRWYVTPSAFVVNIGAAVASKVTVTFQSDGGGGVTFSDEFTLAPGQGLWISPRADPFTGRPATIDVWPGDYVLRATVDLHNRISETNEANNVVELAIHLPR